MKVKFIIFIAFRYFMAKKKSKTMATSMLLIACISLGIMALNVVIGIMNGFQLSFIEPILNVSSYHIQVSGGSIEQDTLHKLQTFKNVSAIVPFYEYDGILERNAILIRALPTDVMQQDPAFASSFYTVDTRNGRQYDLPEPGVLLKPGSILLGNLLSNELLAGKGSEVPVITFSGNMVVELLVAGVFKTGYSVIDESWGFISMETAGIFQPGEDALEIRYGIKLDNRYGDTMAVKRIISLLDDNFEVQTWRVVNSKFFRALLTEKVLMTLIICLIFIIVSFGIFYSLRRTVHEKIEEIALLKALGTPSFSIKNIFIAEGFLIGVIGAAVGTVLGLLVGYNVNEIFRFIETIANDFLFPWFEGLARPFIRNIRFAPVSIFSPDVYYIDKVEVRVILHEAVLVNMFAIVCCVVAAYFASRKIADFKPAVVLRYE